MLPAKTQVPRSLGMTLQKAEGDGMVLLSYLSKTTPERWFSRCFTYIM
jgi:hypothetical protein